jgi:hypothetical protein
MSTKIIERQQGCPMERLIGDLPFLEVLYAVHFLSKGVLDNNIWFLDHLAKFNRIKHNRMEKAK